MLFNIIYFLKPCSELCEQNKNPFFHDKIEFLFGQTLETRNHTSYEIVQALFWIDKTIHIKFVKSRFIVKTMTVNENLYNFAAYFPLIGNIFEFDLVENMIQTKIEMSKLWLRNLISLQWAIKQQENKPCQSTAKTFVWLVWWFRSIVANGCLVGERTD